MWPDTTNIHRLLYINARLLPHRTSDAQACILESADDVRSLASLRRLQEPFWQRVRVEKNSRRLKSKNPKIRIVEALFLAAS